MSEDNYHRRIEFCDFLIRKCVEDCNLIDGNLTGVYYREMLVRTALPQVCNLLRPCFDSIWFQQNSTPPHLQLQVDSCWMNCSLIIESVRERK